MPTTFDGKRGITNGVSKLLSIPQASNHFTGGCIDNVASQYAIVVSRYNDSITQRLLDGALESLQASGVADDDIQVAWVPGAWELPVVAAQFASCGKIDAVICLGAVIRGETTHDQYINSQVASSLGKLSLEHDLPVLFGLLTCETMEQAIHRAGGNVGNKGVEAAEAAVEMVNVMSMILGVLERIDD
jgi:6,7-dimethyl-8-ribityllumazine synthase